MESIIIVGAGLAGVEAARALRSAAFEGRITILSDERHEPYDRPPLSKGYLVGSMRLADLAMQLSACDVDLRLDSPVVALRPSERSVVTGRNERLSADGVVLATGSRARTLPGDFGRHDAVRTLRTLEDADVLRADLTPGRHLVIIGGGLIGSEVASAARTLGLEVTIIEPKERILASLGSVLSDFMSDVHRSHGVEVRVNTSVVALRSEPSATHLVLSDGASLHADVVLAGIGNRPNVEWLKGSGIHVGDGISCDECGRTNIDNVVAVGDCAGWLSSDSTFKRRQHWTAALHQAGVGARSLLGILTEVKPRDMDTVWTDQYGLRVQMVGPCAEVSEEDSPLIFGSETEGSFTTVSCDRTGVVRAVASVNDSRVFARWRRRLDTIPSSEATSRTRSVSAQSRHL